MLDQALRAGADRLIRQVDSRLLVAISLLLAADIAFIAMYGLHEIYFRLYNADVRLLDLRWHIGSDRSYAEMLGYAKVATIVVLLTYTFCLSRNWMYLMWAGAFTYILLDDLMSIHEQLGAAVVDAWRAIWPGHMDEFEPWHKWHRDMGDLAVFAAVGMVLLAMAIAGVARSSRQDRANAILLLLALSALGFFAVGADLTHASSVTRSEAPTCSSPPSRMVVRNWCSHLRSAWWS
jgi:hypothetical protein